VQVIAIIAAACAGLAAGCVLKTALERRQSYWLDYLRRRIPPQQALEEDATPPPPKALPEPWQRQHLIRARGFDVPPEQPLTAQLIRYWQWRDEKVRQALKNDTTTPPGDTHEQR
jgi:hypothetical protein